jgi:hypothetical protein
VAETAKNTIEQLLRLLVKEEGELVRLIELAHQERDALVSSNYAALAAVSEEMLAVAGMLEGFEEERARLLQDLDTPGATLGDLEPLAVAAGVDGLAEARARMLAQTAELQEAQEQNARLILSATRLRERWFRLLAGMDSATYTQAGQAQQGGQRFVSRSA